MSFEAIDMDMLLCEYAFMRTTLDLPDELFRQMKAKAALKGMSLKELLTDYVAKGLGRPASSAPRSHPRSRLPVIRMVGFGRRGPPPPPEGGGILERRSRRHGRILSSNTTCAAATSYQQNRYGRACAYPAWRLEEMRRISGIAGGGVPVRAARAERTIRRL